jgi:hypothetical protein
MLLVASVKEIGLSEELHDVSLLNRERTISGKLKGQRSASKIPWLSGSCLMHIISFLMRYQIYSINVCTILHQIIYIFATRKKVAVIYIDVLQHIAQGYCGI